MVGGRGGQRMVWDRKREEDGRREEGARWREREAVCVGGGIEGPDGGKRGEGMGWGRRPGQGEGQICVCLLSGEGEYK